MSAIKEYTVRLKDGGQAFTNGTHCEITHSWFRATKLIVYYGKHVRLVVPYKNISFLHIMGGI